MNMPPIPDFLLRDPKKSRFKDPQQGEVIPSGMLDTHENICSCRHPLTKKRSLTNSFKEKLATDIITYVSKGFNTFGKLRKVLSDHPNFGSVEDREIKYVATQSHWNDEKKHWYVLFIFETVDPFTEEEMKNTCEGIDELVYLDLEDATIENSTQGLIDIREAMRNPGRTYV